MDRLWIPLVAAVIFNSCLTVAWSESWNKFKPPHHFHDCGSSEINWDNLPDQNGQESGRNEWGSNSGRWGDRQPRPRPPWPRPKPPPTPPPPPPTTAQPPKPSPKVPEDLQTCLRRCPVTSQYNPVCGTDGITYSNVGRLECAQFCGVDVQLFKSSRCTDGSTSTSTTTSKPLPNVQECLIRCPVTSEYNPVCGTDGVTYTNPGRLECAKICGVNVQMAKFSRCPSNPVVTPTPVTPSPVTPSPVTPSPVTPSPVTPSPVTPIVTVSTPKIPSSTSSNLDFTISQDILDQIFGTTTEKDGQDGAGLIDERHDDD